MGSLWSSAEPIPGVAPHAERIRSIAEREPTAQDSEELSLSWRRSANTVDPVDLRPPNILTAHEVKDRRGPLDEFILGAQEEVNRLYRMVRETGYVVLLTDAAGVAVDHRGDDTEKSRFEYWGAWLGGVWSEEIEGTNGIGTCIAEERPVTIHRSQHFRSRNRDLSCSGVPVFGVDGKLIAVLDVSSIDPDRSEAAHALTGALTVNSARAIEERHFRQHFYREWIIAIGPLEESAPGMLLAVDGNQRVVGANRAARASLGIDDRRLQAGLCPWSIFERNHELFRHKNTIDIATRLVLAGGDGTRSALVTAPDRTPIPLQTALNVALHARPRLDMISVLDKTPPAPRAQGGLSPCALRRVQEYVEAHFSENTDLATLASIAELSKNHFAREFRRSVGITPHNYLTQKRVERAQHLLAHTNLSLAEISYDVGFSNQSHLTRHFHHLLGVTPGQFRWLRR
jgi:transcriptional regulator of acetoin/glycerol metabolism/AraC-like DNA-binding protein